jgi:hypothetical protein
MIARERRQIPDVPSFVPLGSPWAVRIGEANVEGEAGRGPNANAPETHVLEHVGDEADDHRGV